jgi:hypothetical protein
VEALAGPLTIAACVLGLSAGLKIADPAPTRGALRAMGLPWSRTAAVGLGGAELVIAVAALVVGSSLTIGFLALAYLGFAGFVAVALRRDTPLASCGCFGRADTPPTVIHLVVNLAFAAVATAVSVNPYGGIDQVLADQPAAGIPFVGFVALGVGATYLVLGSLPRTLAAMTDPHSG